MPMNRASASRRYAIPYCEGEGDKRRLRKDWVLGLGVLLAQPVSVSLAALAQFNTVPSTYRRRPEGTVPAVQHKYGACY
jgi:hypothetical protein